MSKAMVSTGIMGVFILASINNRNWYSHSPPLSSSVSLFGTCGKHLEKMVYSAAPVKQHVTIVAHISSFFSILQGDSKNSQG